MDVTLLGPQRKPAAARAAVAALVPDGGVAAINAGWQERESDSAELVDVLGGRMVNLRLYHRWQQLLAADPGWAAAERGLGETLGELQTVYGLRLQHALAALEAVDRRTEVPVVRAAAHDDAIRTIQDLDRWHLAAVAGAREHFYAEVGLGEHAEVRAHRDELAVLVGSCAGMVVAGGHVGVLLHLLHVFGIAALVRTPLVAWSAGAMALSDRVVLFNDRAAARGTVAVDVRPAEVYADGLGVFTGVLPFPHPRRRLRLDDPGHLAVMAERFAPRVCLLLADGVRVDLPAGGPLPGGARRLDEHGAVVTVEESS